jgi:tetratricopeptide (TPR) repeat protein
MNCPQCGIDNPEGAQFCAKCGASLSAPTAKTGRLRRIKPWMWIVSGCVGLPVMLFVGTVLVSGFMYSSDWCPAFLGCEDWGQVGRGDSYAELGQYEMAIQEYDEAIRLERVSREAYYKRGLAYEALGKTLEAERDFTKAIQEYDLMVFEDSDLCQFEDSDLSAWCRSSAFYGRGLAYEALGKPEEAARDFAKAKELGYVEYDEAGRPLYHDDDGTQSTGLLEAAPEASNFQISLDDFTKKIEVAPWVLEGELSRDATYQSWSFEGNKGQILQFEPRPESGSHIDFGHVEIRLSLVDDELLQTADPEVIGKDEELREIALPETGIYKLQVEGSSDAESSGAYVITISGE